jgi:hypothetical protein
MRVDTFLSAVTSWAAGHADILAVALVGSHARGAAGPDSDVDLVILSERAEDYLTDTAWLSEFGAYSDCHLEDYAAVTSLRVFYDQGPEAEFGFALPAWADLPLDRGSAEVLRSGMRIIHDPRGILAGLQIQPDS